MIEAAGIPTVSTSVLREITEKVRPPRVVWLDRPLGYPLGEAGNAELQKRILRHALGLLSRPVTRTLIEEFRA